MLTTTRLTLNDAISSVRIGLALGQASEYESASNWTRPLTAGLDYLRAGVTLRGRMIKTVAAHDAKECYYACKCVHTTHTSETLGGNTCVEPPLMCTSHMQNRSTFEENDFVNYTAGTCAAATNLHGRGQCRSVQGTGLSSMTAETRYAC